MSKESKKEPLEKKGSLEANERWSAQRTSGRWSCGFCGVSRWMLCESEGWRGDRLLEQWREKAVLGIDEALKNRMGNPLQVELAMAKHPLGQLSLEVERLKRERDLRRP